MKSTKLIKSSSPLITTRKIKNLAKKALLDGFECLPAKGMIYLKDTNIGSVFQNDIIKGILLDVNDCAASVVILEHRSKDASYLGKQRISGNTEVIDER